MTVIGAPRRARDNNVMHAKSGLRVVLKWKIFRPDSVIADVIQPMPKYSIKTLLILMSVFALAALLYAQLAPRPNKFETVRKLQFDEVAGLPAGCVHWFVNQQDRIISALILTGNHPLVLLPHVDGSFCIESTKIEVPSDGNVYIVNPSFELVKLSLKADELVAKPKDYQRWGAGILNDLNSHQW